MVWATVCLGGRTDVFGRGGITVLEPTVSVSAGAAGDDFILIKIMSVSMKVSL